MQCSGTVRAYTAGYNLIVSEVVNQEINKPTRGVEHTVNDSSQILQFANIVMVRSANRSDF